MHGALLVLCVLGAVQCWGGTAEPSRIVPHLRPGPSNLVADFLVDEDGHQVAYEYIVSYKYSPTAEQSRTVTGILPMCTLAEGVLCDMFYTERRTLGDNKELIKARYVGPLAFRAPVNGDDGEGQMSTTREETVVKGWQTLQLTGLERDLEGRFDVLQFYHFPENGVYRFRVDTKLAFLLADGTMEERELRGNTRSLMVDNVHLQVLPTVEEHIGNAGEAHSFEGVKWYNCSLDEIESAAEYLKSARRTVEKALEALEHSLDDTSVELFFGTASNEKRNAIIGAYHHLLDSNIESVRCGAPVCAPHIVGYVYPWDSTHTLFLCHRATKRLSTQLSDIAVIQDSHNCDTEDVDAELAAFIGLMALFEDSAAAVPMLPGRDGALALAKRHPDLTSTAADNLAHYAAYIGRS